MNLLISGYSNGYGGTERFILSQIEHMPNNESYVIYILNDRGYQHLGFENQLRRCDTVEIVSVRTPLRRNFVLFFLEMVRICKYKDIDAMVVNSNTLSPSQAIELFAAMCAGVKVRIVHSHNGGNDNSLKWRVIRFFTSFISKFDFTRIVTNRIACSDVAGKWEFGNKQYTVILNGIDTVKFRFSSIARREKRQELGIGDNEQVFLHVGRIARQKNTAFIIDLFLEYAKTHEAVLLLAGGAAQDGEADKVARILEKSNAHNAIRLLGIREDIPELMSASDVFLLLSLYEGFPIVSVEAQCSGLVNILSDVVSPEILITDNVVFGSLNDSKDNWLKLLESSYKKATAVSRNEACEAVRCAGYDIHDSSKSYWHHIGAIVKRNE